MNIKNMINMIFKKYQDLSKRFPLTLIVIALITVLLTIFMDNMDNNFINRVLEFLFIYIIGTMFTEITFDKKKRMFSYLVFAILSLFLVILDHSTNELIANITERVLYTYFLSFIIIIFYKLYKNSQKDLAHYTLSISFNILKTSIIYGILSIGLLLISEVFVNLILNNDNYEIILRVEILLMGLFYAPNILEDVFSVQEDINSFMKIIVHYTLLSLIILAFIIIYLYLFKIIITWDFPSNQIFRILTILFIFYLPIWIMNNYYKEDLLSKINSKLPYMFIPFILLQIYSLGIRIMNNGITNMRYIGIMIILIEIVYIILFLRKMKLDYLFYLLPIIIVITFIIPYLNMYDVSCYSQRKIMDNLLAKEELSNDDKMVIYSSYEYLNASYMGRNYLNKYSDDIINEIKGFNYYQDYDFHYINVSVKLDGINIDNYRTLYNLEYRNYLVDDKNIVINKDNYNIDITNIIRAYIENNVDIDNYFRTHHEFVIDNNKLIISNIVIEYNNEKIKYLSIDGIVLK